MRDDGSWLVQATARVCAMNLMLHGIGSEKNVPVRVADALAADPVRLTTDGHIKRDPVFLNAQGTELLYVVLNKPNQLRL